METIPILFLGASRLVGLMERFNASAAAEGVNLSLMSVEDDSPWHAVAVAGLCRVLPGPRFTDPSFNPFIMETVVREKVRVVIPNIDPATVAISKAAGMLRSAGAVALVSSPELCETMRDKVLADAFFRSRGISMPSGDAWPRLAKPRFGSSSRGHVVFKNAEELAFWSARHNADEFILQPFLAGTEYSVDAFISTTGKRMGAVARIRVMVSGGEVMVARTDRNERVLALADKVLDMSGWHGPINIQIMDTASGPVLIEVNPRFSSGFTCAIEAGLDAPRWILRECLGRPLPETPVSWKSGLVMTRSRKDHFTWSL